MKKLVESRNSAFLNNLYDYLKNTSLGKYIKLQGGIIYIDNYPGKENPMYLIKAYFDNNSLLSHHAIKIYIESEAYATELDPYTQKYKLIVEHRKN